MACPECEKNKKKTAKDFTKAVVEIKNPDKLVLFRKVVVPASMGTEEQFPASVGKFSNVLLQYEANGDTYLYSSDGIPTQLSSDVSELQRQLDELKIVVTNEIADRIAADGTINSRIDQEILDRQAADNDLSDALAAEVAARKAADNTLDGKITTEKNARIAADNTLQTNINNEATARAAADNTLDGKITTEKEAREAADRTLQTNINNEATTRANADTALGTRITNETTARQNADNALDGRITTEANTRSAADSALAEDISAEVTRAKAAETALGGRIDDEATTRAAADTTLDGKITAEATARANADSTLDGKITDEATARANADTALGTRITDETTARTNADTAINNKLNRNVLYDLEMQTDANNVTFVEDKVNLGTGATTTERDVIPAASATTAGTISASEYVSLVDAEEKITALLEGAVAIDNLPANPTQQQLTNAWLAATGKTELINRASIYDSANQLVHTYYTNVAEWEDSPAGGQITIDQFTNSAAGIIKGSTTDGNVSANLDGTGTVSGWTALKNTVAGKANSSDLATVATSGSYNDLSNKPTIPTVNNATLTIQKNGTTVKTFTANASTNVTANITVPTKTSELTNDSNFPVDANYVHTDNNFTTTLKNKLDGIAAGAEVNQNAFSTVKVGSTNVAADSKTDTLELVAGSNVTLTPDATNDKVTIAATDTTYSDATTSTAGLMSAADKTAFENLKPVVRKLYSDGTTIPENADLNTPTYLTVGRYGCRLNNTAASLANCPTYRGFMMDVYNTIDTNTDNQTTASWTSRTRKILDFLGREWVQTVERSGGTITYGSWEQTAHLSDLPTVNNATLTIQKNGTNVQTFTANSSTNKTANITVPTKVTDLTDAANYVAKDGAFYVTGEGSTFSMTGTSQNVYADLKVKGDTKQTTYSGKNLCNGISQGYFINVAATECGKTENDSGLAIPVQANTTYTVSTTKSQTRYRIAVMNTLPTSSAPVGAYNGVNKDGKSDSITISSSSYTYLVVNATDLSAIQVELGSTATAYEPYVGGVPSPNPNYPQEVEVVTGRQVIASMGKNLLSDHLTGSINWNGTRVDYYGDEIKISKTGGGDISANPHTAAQYTPLKQGNTYTFSAKYNRGTIVLNGSYSWVFYVYGVYPDGTTSSTADSRWQLFITRTSTTPDRASVTFTPTKDFIGFKLGCYIAVDTPNTTGDVYFDCQLEKGSAVTPFEPYLGKEYEINLGKNLFDKDNASQIIQGYIGTGKFYTASNYWSYYIPCEPGTTYTASRKNIGNGGRFAIATSSVTPANNITISNQYQDNAATELSITTGRDAKYIIVWFANTNDASSASASDWEAVQQIEKGSTATSYAPYFTPIELCKIGTYQDYVYPSRGKWYLHKAIGKSNLATDGVDWISSTTYVANDRRWCIRVTQTDVPYLSDSSAIFACFCSHFKGDSRGGTYGEREGIALRAAASDTAGYLTFNMFIESLKTANLQAFKDWLAANEPVVYYQSTAPTDTEITNPLLVAQLDDLWRNLQSGTNTTNVGVEGDLPAILGVTAFTNTLASAMAGINERMNRLPAIPQITMTTTDPGEGQTLADNHYIAVFE